MAGDTAAEVSDSITLQRPGRCPVFLSRCLCQLPVCSGAPPGPATIPSPSRFHRSRSAPGAPRASRPPPRLPFPGWDVILLSQFRARVSLGPCVTISEAATFSSLHHCCPFKPYLLFPNSLPPTAHVHPSPRVGFYDWALGIHTCVH